MTALVKAVRREVGRMDLGGGDSGSYIVSLIPPGLLEFRRKRSRKRYTVTLKTCYQLAARIEAEQLRKQRAETRRQRSIQRRNGQ